MGTIGTISLVIPQIGQPDTTEDVKLQNALTTIQTVINGNLDRSNLAAGVARLLLTSKGANYAAVDGDLVEVTAVSTTITLPTPTAGVTIGVFAASGATSAATPVTVTASSGSIASAGSLASPRTLGSPYVGVLLVADGSNWLTVSGQWDTGWTALGGLTGGITAATGFYAPGARKLGDRVYLRGGIQAPAGSGTVAWSTSTPAGMTPASSTGFAVGFNSQLPVTASLVQGSSGIAGSGGTISIANIPVSYIAMLDGISYSIN